MSAPADGIARTQDGTLSALVNTAPILTGGYVGVVSSRAPSYLQQAALDFFVMLASMDAAWRNGLNPTSGGWRAGQVLGKGRGGRQHVSLGNWGGCVGFG